MKKTVALLLILALVAVVFSACTSKTTTGTTVTTIDNSTETTSTTKETAIDPTDHIGILKAEYRSGKWDGTKRPMGDKVYFVDDDGILTMIEDINGVDDPVLSGEGCPDAPDYVKVSKSVSFEDGIVVINSDFTTLAYCVRGKLVSSCELEGGLADVINGQFEMAAFNEGVVIKEGQHLAVYNPLEEFEQTSFRDDVIDFKVESSGELCISTIKAVMCPNNYLFANGEWELTGSHFEKFPKHIKANEVKDEKYISDYYVAQLFYVGTGADQKYYYLVNNLDGQTYTLYYRDVESGINKAVSKTVLDAEGTTLGCYFIDLKDTYTYFVGVNNNPKVVFTGTSYALTPAIGEDDTPCVVTTEAEANLFASNGWDNLWNPVRG